MGPNKQVPVAIIENRSIQGIPGWINQGELTGVSLSLTETLMPLLAGDINASGEKLNIQLHEQRLLCEFQVPGFLGQAAIYYICQQTMFTFFGPAAKNLKKWEKTFSLPFYLL